MISSVILYSLLATSSLSFPLDNGKSFMKAVPSYDTPAYKSVANYVKPMTETAGVAAQINIEASIPSIHLVNVPEIKSVECTKKQLILTTNSIYLIQEWEETKTLLVVDHSFACLGQDTIMLTTDSWKFESDRVIFDVLPLKKTSGITGDIQIEIKSIDLVNKNSKFSNQTLVYPFTFAKSKTFTRFDI